MPPLPRLREHGVKSERDHHHPALQDDIFIGPDIYTSLFDWFFKSDEFTNWLRQGSGWQLRCHGSPGSGKSTLSALTRRHLLHNFRATRQAVASVFITADVSATDDTFITSFLASILRQLSPFLPSTLESQEEEEEEAEEADNGSSLPRPPGRDAHALRAAICALLDEDLDLAFLIVDDLNNCGHLALQAELEQELRHLQERGVKVMVSSRVPRLDENSLIAMWCDCVECALAEAEIEVRVYWTCETCGFVVCVSCRDGGRFCERCGDLPCLRQKYDHVSINVGQVGDPLMRSYVCWALEQEHGDLGFGSAGGTPRGEEDDDDSSNQHQQMVLAPLSALGASLSRAENAVLLAREVDGIVHLADENLSMARLRLDNFHLVPSADGLDAPAGDRLPGNIVAFFDAAVASVLAQPEPRRSLGLLAVAAMSTRSYFSGLPLADLDRVVDVFNRSGSGGGGGDNDNKTEKTLSVGFPGGVEEVLLAAQGFLVVEPVESQPLRAFHPAFYAYVRDGYSEVLRWWVVNLRFDNTEWFRRVIRTKTALMDKRPVEKAAVQVVEREARLGKDRSEIRVKLVRKSTFGNKNRALVRSKRVGTFEMPIRSRTIAD